MIFDFSFTKGAPMRALAGLNAIFFSVFLFSACDDIISLPRVDVHDYIRDDSAFASPGFYVEERLAVYMEEVFDAYVSVDEKDRGTKNFSSLAIELTARAPTPMVAALKNSVSLPNPTDPLPPYDFPSPWWNAVPGWRFESPNKVIISFFHDPTWELEAILGAAFSAFAANQSAGTAFPAGITISSTLEKRLGMLWSETKACTGFSDGETGELAIYLMPPSFSCYGGARSCSGLFSPWNTVRIGRDEYTAKHEFLHYLLQENAGGLDRYHESPFFQDCTG